MTMIKYLLKFVTKLEHAEALVAGQLYMRPASYFHSQEIGRGDICEGCVIPNLCAYRNTQWAIYCFYAVEESEIDKNGVVSITERCIQDFGCSDGYVVVLPYAELEKRFPTVKTDGYAMIGGPVCYHRITNEDIPRLFTDENALNLRVKGPYFAHQKEYRLIITETIPDGVEAKTYRFQTELGDIAWIAKVSEMQQCENQYLLNVNDLYKV